METVTLETDIRLMYVTAASFPEGIAEAHETLHAVVPFSTKRRYYGISRPEHGPIVYRAAAEERHTDEAEELGLETLILKKGRYVCLTVHDYTKDILSIQRAFQELLALPGLDPQGYCVEEYTSGKDVRCMIRKDG